MDNVFCQPSPCVIALGMFDGMHPGHMAVIDRAVSIARSMGIPARVFTFYENPRDVFGKPVRQLMTPEEKQAAMKARGIEEVIMVHFTKEFASNPPEEFARMLVRDYGARAVVSGEDYTFGRKAEGNVEALKRFGKEMGFEVIVAPTVMIVTEKGETKGKVSSTAIRSALDAHREDIVQALMDGKPVPENN